MVVLTGRAISEKTLELNICAEILAMVRAQPGYEKAIWQGMTQRQERSTGLDELLRNLGRGQFLMLQFKSPWPSSDVDTKYKFSINTLQHVTLEQGLGLRYPDAVFYVLPLFTRWDKVNQYAPRLASDTWMLRATDIDSTALGFTQQRHRVEVVKNGRMPTVSVFSPVVDDLEVLNAEQAFHEPDSSVPKSSWIPSGAIQEWAEGIMSRFEPKRLRGLHSLFLPLDL